MNYNCIPNGTEHARGYSKHFGQIDQHVVDYLNHQRSRAFARAGDSLTAWVKAGGMSGKARLEDF